MEIKESIIFTNLITDQDFRDLVVNLTSEKKYLWKDYINAREKLLPEIKKAREFIVRLKFEKHELLPDELNELLEKVISNETSDLNRQP